MSDKVRGLILSVSILIAVILDYLLPGTQPMEVIKAEPVTIMAITAAALAAGSLATTAVAMSKKGKKPKPPPSQRLLDPEDRRSRAMLLNPTGGQGVAGAAPGGGTKVLLGE